MRRAVVRRSADKHEAAVAIATFYHAAFIDFEPDSRMPQCGRNAVAAAVAGNTVGADEDGFRRVVHVAPLAKPPERSNGAFY